MCHEPKFLRKDKKGKTVVVVHSWKPLLSGFHYHFWPILGLILQDANREEEEAVVSTLKGSKLHTTKVSDGWLCLFSGTLDFVIKLESKSYKMQYYNNKIQFLAENVFEFSRLFIERLPDDVKEIATQSARQIVR